MLLRLAAISLAVLAAIALTTLATLPASAFEERHAHWTVLDSHPLVPGCAAINRPPDEFAAQPYAALSIRQDRNIGPRLFVFAWPGAFKYGDRLTIELGIGPGPKLAAEAQDSHVVVTREDLPQELIADMHAARFVSFDITGLSQALMFDTSQLDAVMKSLAACVRQQGG
jgi:hypothetical protein